MSELDPSLLQSESFSIAGKTGSGLKITTESVRHAQALVGSPAQPGLFSRLAEHPLLREPSEYDRNYMGPLPDLTHAIVFATARQAVPYGDAMLAFWQTVRPEAPEDQLPSLDIVDPSIHKGHSKSYESTENSQHERLTALAQASDEGTIAYVFDECVIEGKALGRAVQIITAAGFQTVSSLRLTPLWFGDDGIHLNFSELPFDRDGPHNELVPNENPARVAALHHDMQLIGKTAAENYLEFLEEHPPEA